MQALHRPVKSRAAAIIPAYLYPANPASRITHHASRITHHASRINNHPATSKIQLISP